MNRISRAVEAFRVIYLPGWLLYAGILCLLRGTLFGLVLGLWTLLVLVALRQAERRIARREAERFAAEVVAVTVEHLRGESR